VGKTDKYLHTFKRYANGSIKTVDNLSTVFTNQFVFVSNAITYRRYVI